MVSFKKVAVIGAGVMGSGIAAHLANAGVEVVLLDLDAKFAREGVAKQLKAGGFMRASFAERITTGATSELSLVAGADWIIEAVAEKPEIKRDLFQKLESVRKDGSIVSSNTSTIPLDVLTEGLGARFAGDFLITHFFNPPRYMRLLEIVSSLRTRPEAEEAVRAFSDIHLGKGLVTCKDTPGFIANRIGCLWLAAGLVEALKLGVSVEEADAVIGKPFGIPSTGIFGLLDLVGVDLMPHILGSLHKTLPPGDLVQSYSFDIPLINTMIAEGRIGRKAGAGFFRQAQRDGNRVREALDLTSGAYRDLQKPDLQSLGLGARDLRALLSHGDRGGLYAWAVMGRTLAYAASLVPEIADTPAEVDEAMRLGYAWGRGPFELIDAVGPAWFAEQLAKRGEKVPPILAQAAQAGSFYRIADAKREILAPAIGYLPLHRAAGVLSLDDLKLAAKPVAGNSAASIWDLGDGVACLEFHTKMNAFDSDLMTGVESALDETARNFQALVIGNEGAAFSAGANLKPMLDAAERGDFAFIEAFCIRGQQAFRRLKFAAHPSVAAVAGMALGGGCEIALHCSAIQAHAETNIGLVETNIGVIPGWGGGKELLLRLIADKSRTKGPVAPALAAFETIFPAKISSSAFQAQELGFLRATDGVTMNRERLLADAKARALALVKDYKAPEPALVVLSGPSGRQALRNAIDTAFAAGRIKPHDRVVAETLAEVLSGGASDPTRPQPEDVLFDLERAGFMELVRTEPTRARIRAMLETGKPLRN
ncbi:FAD-dependent oxidoreductase [Rhodoblastus sp.]|uniref:3-hydroxyacyl-CoA dehydrogenase/enoyl-CoA hydratase family protein n=1 Tax=Rhodoblastus sp. TaxID=1962975 RepID=UPI003F95DF13